MTKVYLRIAIGFFTVFKGNNRIVRPGMEINSEINSNQILIAVPIKEFKSFYDCMTVIKIQVFV